MPKRPFQNEGRVGSFQNVKPQATPWLGKEALKELPAPARWWERVAGGYRGKHAKDKKFTAPKQHVLWSASTSRATGTFQQFSWVAKRFFGVCCVCWGHAVTTISSFLNIAAPPVSPCGALNFRIFHGQALKSALLRHLQEHLQIHLFVKLQFQIITRFVSQARCHSKDKKKKKKKKEQRNEEKSKHFHSTFFIMRHFEVMFCFSMQLNMSFLKQKFHLIPNLKHLILNEILQATKVSVCAEKQRK